MPGVVLPILFIVSDIFFDSYPLKQFAPVFHGNNRIRAASQWAKTLAGRGWPFLPELENRYYVLGRTNMNRLLFAVFTIRNEKIRIISARDMTVSEIERYQK